MSDAQNLPDLVHQFELSALIHKYDNERHRIYELGHLELGTTNSASFRNEGCGGL